MSANVEGVLMVGSVPGDSSQQVFTRLASALPGRLHTIPDGETGERWCYIFWQRERFPPETVKPLRTESKQDAPDNSKTPDTGPARYSLDDVKPTGYDDAAIASYAEFKALRERGIIPQSTRFQIGLPTPYSVVFGHVKPAWVPEMQPLYEQRFFETLDRIVDAIPASDMVIQWDLCFEVMNLEYDRCHLRDDTLKAPFSPVKEKILEHVFRLCERIPPAVPLAFHLCYGDLGHRHFIEPIDTALLVELANDLLARLGRHIEWIHLPVPKNRVDEEYFLPLRDLQLRQARLYLGLAHANDESGTRERISVAQKVYPYAFGIATECGLGRTPSEEVDSVLGILASLSSSTADKPQL